MTVQIPSAKIHTDKSFAWVMQRLIAAEPIKSPGSPVTGWVYGKRPSVVGVYERNDTGTDCSDGTPAYSYWDGHKWSSLAATISEAFNTRKIRSQFQETPWRALAVER